MLILNPALGLTCPPRRTIPDFLVTIGQKQDNDKSMVDLSASVNSLTNMSMTSTPAELAAAFKETERHQKTKANDLMI